jgi:CubicO group peptidase (beta-lactamase class C family)
VLKTLVSLALPMIFRNRHRRRFPIAGEVEPGFTEVDDAFRQNFDQRGEEGAACTLYYRGRKVVDIWGGYRCYRTGKRWEPSTLVLTYSVTKGMAAAALAVAHSRGLWQLDERVATYWPEFGQAGKQAITVRQLLAHQAGLIGLGRRLRPDELGDLDLLARMAAKSRPAWPTGERHGYHTLSLGWFENELIRRVDPQRRSLGTFFQDEIARPLGVEFYIGLPTSIAGERVATIQGFPRRALFCHLHELPLAMILAGVWPCSWVARSVGDLPLGNPALLNESPYRYAEIPSANGIGAARAIAKVYDALLGLGDNPLQMKAETVRELQASPLTPRQGGRDAILKIDTQYAFGFSRPSQAMRFGSDGRAFGTFGAGGAFGMADPAGELAYAYVTNKMGFRLYDDPREVAVRDACYRCVQRLEGALPEQVSSLIRGAR